MNQYVSCYEFFVLHIYMGMMWNEEHEAYYLIYVGNMAGQQEIQFKLQGDDRCGLSYKGCFGG